MRDNAEERGGNGGRTKQHRPPDAKTGESRLEMDPGYLFMTAGNYRSTSLLPRVISRAAVRCFLMHILAKSALKCVVARSQMRRMETWTRLTITTEAPRTIKIMVVVIICIKTSKTGHRPATPRRWRHTGWALRALCPGRSRSWSRRSAPGSPHL